MIMRGRLGSCPRKANFQFATRLRKSKNHSLFWENDFCFFMLRSLDSHQNFKVMLTTVFFNTPSIHPYKKDSLRIWGLDYTIFQIKLEFRHLVSTHLSFDFAQDKSKEFSSELSFCRWDREEFSEFGEFAPTNCSIGGPPF